MKSDVESKSLSFKKLTINSFLNPLYNRIKNSDRRNNFENAKKQYLLNLQMHKEENEDHLVANVLAQFLRNLDFEVKVKSKQKGKSEIDLVILKDSNIEVIIEAKKPNNRDFISTNINSKALHEAILYYFREREKQNSSIKHIIITDFYRFFIFEAKEFERLFYKNKSFKKLYENFISNSSLFEGNTKEFYSEISKILDSQEYQNEALNGLDIDIKSTDSNLYKVFHRDFLLNEFNPNDANTLNQNFYNELLYILGLCEKSINGKILLKPSDQTLGAKGTLYYNIFNNLAESKKDLESFKNGEIDENILEILIIWINRILFLKLLESNLINFNNDKNLSFLNKEKIPNYIILNDLFFKILARKIEDRDDSNPTLAYLPYLNSSLFSKDSKEFIEIRTLSDLELEYFSNTQIKDIHAKQKQGKQKWLYYLFEFLDAFDFGVIEGDLKVESSIDSLTNTPPHLEQKPLINSSVLGLVFEKLNGYKEGSFYTPSFITSYMCKESLNKIVLAKFNTLNPNWNAKNLDNIAEEIQAQIRSNRDKSQEIKESYKNLLDSIRICDPAVGSGHFLVSTLNELIYIHHYLGLFLSDCEVSLINDELFIKDSAGEVFSYKRPKKENKNHQIQKELFALKKSIIENNLFGVDINPNSVNICRLRLWIELLKNSYYLSYTDSNYQDLNTLPNIDINIKCGNSLVSYFDIQANLAHYPNIGTKMQDYKRVVQNYKEGFYQDKLQIDKQIKDLLQAFKNFCFKDKFKKEIKSFDIKCEEYSKKYGNYLAKDDNDLSLYVQQRLFVGEFDTKVAKKEFDALKKEYESIFNLESNKPFEWRFAFPEVLDSNGDFLGFDLVIGNPPYGVDLSKNERELYKKTYNTSQTNTAALFMFLSDRILAPNGINTLIVPKSLNYVAKWEQLRDFIAPSMYLLADCGKAWDYVLLEMVIFARAKGKNYPSYENLLLQDNTNTQDSKAKGLNIDKSLIELFGLFINGMSEEELKIGKKIKNEINTSLLNFAQCFRGGSFQKDITEKSFNRAYKVLGGKEVQKYYVRGVKGHISQSAKISSEADIKENSILLQRIIAHIQNPTPHIKFTATILQDKDYKIVNTIFQIICNKNVSNKLILGLLHSNFLNWYCYRFGFAKAIRSMDFSNEIADKIPIPKINAKNQTIANQIIALVDEILAIKAKDSTFDTSNLESQIDSLVYQLYNLTSEEIKIVEGK